MGLDLEMTENQSQNTHGERPDSWEWDMCYRNEFWLIHKETKMFHPFI